MLERNSYSSVAALKVSLPLTVLAQDGHRCEEQKISDLTVGQRRKYFEKSYFSSLKSIS